MSYVRTDSSPLPRVFWFLFAGLLLNAMGTFLLPYLALYLEDLHVSAGVIGLIVGSYGIGSVIAGLVGGFLADFWGRQASIILSFVAAGCLTCLLPLVEGPVAVGCGVAAIGFAGNIYRPAMNALVGDLIGPDDRTKAFGYLYWAVNIGFSIAAAVGGFLAHRSYTLLFLVDGITCIIAAVIVFIGLLRIDLRTYIPAKPRAGGGNAIKPQGLWLRSVSAPYWGFLGLTLLFCTVQTQPWVSVPLVATSRGLSTREWGFVTAVNGITVVILQPLAARVTKGRGLGHVLGISFAFVGVGFTMVAWIGTLPLFMFHTFVWTLGEILFGACAPALASLMAQPETRGRMMGLFSATASLATVIAPTTGGWAIGHLPENSLWYLCGFACIIGLVFCFAQNGAYQRTIVALNPSPPQGAGQPEEGSPPQPVPTKEEGL